MRGRPLQDFFAFIEAPQQRGSSRLQLQLPAPRRAAPIVRDPQRRGGTNAIDLDFGGRRRGGPDPDDDNGNITGEDVLPGYEVKGGPPEYGRTVTVDLGGADVRLHITGTTPVGSSHQSQSPETPSEVADSSLQTSHPLDDQLPRPPPPSYTPDMAPSQ